MQGNSAVPGRSWWRRSRAPPPDAAATGRRRHAAPRGERARVAQDSEPGRARRRSDAAALSSACAGGSSCQLLKGLLGSWVRPGLASESAALRRPHFRRRVRTGCSWSGPGTHWHTRTWKQEPRRSCSPAALVVRIRPGSYRVAMAQLHGQRQQVMQPASGCKLQLQRLRLDRRTRAGPRGHGAPHKAAAPWVASDLPPGGQTRTPGPIPTRR